MMCEELLFPCVSAVKSASHVNQNVSEVFWALQLNIQTQIELRSILNSIKMYRNLMEAETSTYLPSLMKTPVWWMSSSSSYLPTHPPTHPPTHLPTYLDSHLTYHRPKECVYVQLFWHSMVTSSSSWIQYIDLAYAVSLGCKNLSITIRLLDCSFVRATLSNCMMPITPVNLYSREKIMLAGG